MPFRLSLEARDWFAELRRSNQPGFDMDFDSYYFCFVAGVVFNRKAELPTVETVEIVDAFPGRYRARGKLLAAVFLSRELASAGVTLDEKSSVHSVISQLVDPTAPSTLSSKGQAEFNRYAFGGFEVLREWFSGKPATGHVFARTFKSKVDSHLASHAEGWPSPTAT